MTFPLQSNEECLIEDVAFFYNLYNELVIVSDRKNGLFFFEIVLIRSRELGEIIVDLKYVQRLQFDEEIGELAIRNPGH